MRSFAPFALLAALAALPLSGTALAHPATEQFIPIGETPGPGAVQGRAQAVAEPSTVGGETIVTIVADGAQLPFVIGATTRIYLDRSAEHQPNTIGDVSDVQPGRILEVRIADPATKAAEWVKVRR